MPALSAPTVREPFYECASTLGVSGYVPGANVSIFAEPPGGGAPVQIGGGVSNSANGQIFGVTQANIVPDARITAIQTYGGNTSPASAPVIVQRALSIDEPLLSPPLLECARCIKVDGLLPGVKVEVRDGSSTIGQSSAAGEAVSVHVVPPLVTGHKITARQVYCGNAGPDSAAITVGSARDPKLPLPAPEVNDPIFACEPSCVVWGCMPGSQVELFVDGMPKTSGCSSGTAVNLRVIGGLVEATQITARLSLCGGAIQSPLSAPVTVRPASEIPRPAIWPPLYEGDTSVLVGMTVNGEIVSIAADGTQIGMGGGAGGNTQLNVDPPLVAGQKVVATVELCSVKKDSLPVTVLPKPKKVPPPKILEPVHACSTLVQVLECIPGAEVRVFASAGGNTVLLGLTKTLGTSAGVHVTPPLKAGWSIHATQKTGGITSPNSAAVIVVAPPGAIPVPKFIEPIYECSRCVKLDNLLTGARVDVYQGNVWVGSAEATNSTAVVSVYPGLTSGATLTATQAVCGKTGKPGKATVVRSPEKVPAPQLLPAFAYKAYVEATDFIPGAIVEVEEISVYNLVIGRTCVTDKNSTIGLMIPLFAGARLRARQRLCQWSPYSSVIVVSQPEEWPLGAGPYKAGFQLVSDIPVSANIDFQQVSAGPCNGGLFDFTRPATHSAIVFYPATAEGDSQPFAGGGPFPVIVYGHGRRWPSCFSSFRWDACPGAPTDTNQDYRQLSGILSHLARWGFVCVSPDLSWLAPEFNIDDWLWVFADAGSYLAAENTRAGSPFQGQLNTASFNVMGHSTSGIAAIEIAAGGQLAVGTLGLLAPAGGSGTVGSLAPRPVMVLRGTNDTGPFGDGGESDDVYAAAGPSKHMITIDGANHFGFADSLCIVADPAAAISQADQQRIAKAYLTAFFRRYVQGVLAVEDYLAGVRQIEELEAFAITVDAQV
jgi:hypothetical protein